MDIRFLRYQGRKFIGERQARPDELLNFQLVKRALYKAAELAECFPDTFYITDYGEESSKYDAIFYTWQDGGTIWMHEVYLKRMEFFNENEMVAGFLHENGHHLLRQYPGYLEQLLEYDPAWNQLLARHPDIKKKSWFPEIKADIYATRILGGLCYWNWLYKEYRLNYGQEIITYDAFPESRTHPSLRDRFTLLNCYCEHQVDSEIRAIGRAPFRVKRTIKTYKTTSNDSEEELKFNGQRAYYRYIAQSRDGYDFLQKLLSVYDPPLIRSKWSKPPQYNEDNKQQLLDDITMLMRQLMGSSNLFVDERGIFRNDSLPYGAVRAYRASLSRTALHANGRIERIKTNLSRIGLSDETLIIYLRKLDRLHDSLQFPSFELQNALRNSMYIDNLPGSKKKDQSISQK